MKNRTSSVVRLVTFVMVIALAVLISACSPKTSQGTPTREIMSTATQASLPVQTEAPAAAETQSPTATESATAAETPPSAILTPEPALPSGDPPVVAPDSLIAPGNAGQVVELAGWGKGFDFDLATISNSQLAASGEVLVATEYLGEMPDISSVTRTRFWDVPSGKLRKEIFDPQGYESIMISPDGSLFAIYRGSCPNLAGEPCSVEVWDVEKDEQLLSLEVDYFLTAAISPDNRRLALSTGLGIEVWDLETGEMMHTLPESAQLDRLQFSNNGEMLAGFQQLGTLVNVWQVESGELLATLVSEQFAGVFFPSAVAFSPDDTQLAVAFNWSVELWSVADWSEGIEWQAHESVVTKVAFAPDGRLVASGAEDGSVALANAATAEVLAQLNGHSVT
jgi:hypothetical protein